MELALQPANVPAKEVPPVETVPPGKLLFAVKKSKL
jgi:hypothetical protein